MLENAQKKKPGTSVGKTRGHGNMIVRNQFDKTMGDGMKFININERNSISNKRFGKHSLSKF